MRVVWSILVCLCLVGCMNPKNKAIGVYDTSQLPSDFGGGEAYEIGMNQDGRPVFVNPDAAFKQIVTDYKDGFKALTITGIASPAKIISKIPLVLKTIIIAVLTLAPATLWYSLPKNKAIMPSTNKVCNKVLKIALIDEAKIVLSNLSLFFI